MPRYVDQPKRKTIQTRHGTIDLDWDPIFSSRWNIRYNRAQRYVDARVLYLSEDYIPVDTGELLISGRRNTRIGSGMVVWKAEHARAIYYGRRARHGVGKKVSKGRRWFQRMKQMSGKKIVVEAKRIIGGGTNG